MPYRLVDVSCWIDAFQAPGDQPVVVTGPFDYVGGDNPEYVHDLSTPTSAGVESRTSSNHEVNVSLCRGGVLILEGLVNLGSPSGGRLWLQPFPLKKHGGEGPPCRAAVKEHAATVAGPSN